MLELRPVCENCKKSLPPNSTEAMICTFECTYCKECAIEIFQNVCPNCGGGFHQRPVRPSTLLVKYPPTNKIIYQPKDMDVFQEKLKKYVDISPEKR